MNLTDDFINKALCPYIRRLEPLCCERIRRYTELLLHWNQRISLTTVTDPLQVLTFHFGESFFAAPALGITDGFLADIGSGAGFPGLALKLILTDLSVTLVESNVKKAAFLSEVIRALNLSSVNVFRGRMEDFEPDQRQQYITARALGSFETLLGWSSRHLAENGKEVLWLGGEDAKRIVHVPSWSWQIPIPIPHSKNRFILEGSPIVSVVTDMN